LSALNVCVICTNANTISCAITGIAVTCSSGYYPLNGVCNTCASVYSVCP
jgi:hypothetical protein